MAHSQKSMAACPQENKQMYTMQYSKMKKAKNNTQSKYTRHLYWSLKTERDMCRANSDSEGDIVLPTLEKW